MSNNPATQVPVHSPAMVAIVIEYDRLLQRYARRITRNETLAALIVPEAFRCYEKRALSLSGMAMRKALQAETLGLCQQRLRVQQSTIPSSKQHNPINL